MICRDKCKSNTMYMCVSVWFLMLYIACYYKNFYAAVRPHTERTDTRELAWVRVEGRGCMCVCVHQRERESVSERVKKSVTCVVYYIDLRTLYKSYYYYFLQSYSVHSTHYTHSARWEFRACMTNSRGLCTSVLSLS